MKALQSFLKTSQTKFGLVFGLFVPLFFIIVWMTGYSGATNRIDQLHAAVVNEDGSKGAIIANQITQLAPFQTKPIVSIQDAQAKINAGEIAMIISIQKAKLTYYINEGNSDIAKAMMEKAALEISKQLNQIGKQIVEDPIQTDIVKTNPVNDFSTSMLPMLLGFIAYIAMMTMNIQFNLASLMLKREYSKWQIFFARQMLYIAIAIVFPFIITSVAMLFSNVHSSFISMWTFQILVFLSCMCVTQMGFALFGHFGPLFNIALVPLQLMTGGNIIPTTMLTPFYRQFDNFLPASNAIQGYLHLIYSGSSISTYVVNLILISIVSWGITVICLALKEKSVASIDAPLKHAQTLD
ncbi:hypothetical protein Back11_62000 [Paenibacillus baekrokdamisoli]|uniref:Uncharacterized protein n=1 Tax=Paenibacillus baekrokdamisoli TaxID=1712516 RepID=A0A3G9J935_9BACL|nr:ABC transporter permease [Paenibacillus baekrokdamisoli]MBB3072272.1 ABC-type multidrug transport system permease subunit [Paenibacillus baekrokdamisoli]BBH24855.1 hypothetical protein Back11_62000 [Paenibacillus baekrokdamisoli]